MEVLLATGWVITTLVGLIDASSSGSIFSCIEERPVVIV